MNKNVAHFKNSLLGTIKHLEDNYHQLNLLRSYDDPAKRQGQVKKTKLISELG